MATSTLHPTRQAAKVAAVNKAHEYANKLYETLAPYFAQFIGQKLYKADGTLLKKIAEGMPALPDTGQHPTRGHVCRGSFGAYSLYWNVRFDAATPGYFMNGAPSGCDHQESHEVGVYIGHMRSGVLESMYPADERRTDWTDTEVAAKLAELNAIKESFGAAKSALWPFAENVR